MIEMALVLKLLDLAALGFAAWERYDERKREGTAAMADIEDIRRRLLAGELSTEAASAEVDKMVGRLVMARKAAMGRLPTYPVSELDD